MTRRPSNTQPMARVADTEPIPPPSAALERETTDPSSAPVFEATFPPAMQTPVMNVAAEVTEPDGIDPLLAAFNRPPRPPAPKPAAKASTDGDEFASHYAPPARLGTHARPAEGPAQDSVLIATTEPPPLARPAQPNDTTPDPPALVARRDHTTHVPRERLRKIALRRTLLGVGAVAVLSAALCVAYISTERSAPTSKATTTITASATGTGALIGAASSPVNAGETPSGPVVASPAPTPLAPSHAASASPPPTAFTTPSAARTATAPATEASGLAAPPRASSAVPHSSPRSAASERPRTAPARPSHETPDTDL